MSYKVVFSPSFMFYIQQNEAFFYCYILLWSSLLRLSLHFQRQKKLITIKKLQQGTGEGIICCYMVLRMRKGKVKKKVSIESFQLDKTVWNTWFHFHVCGCHWSNPEPAVWHRWEWTNLQTQSTCSMFLVTQFLLCLYQNHKALVMFPFWLERGKSRVWPSFNI